jgi:hypothetical protein
LSLETSYLFFVSLLQINLDMGIIRIPLRFEGSIGEKTAYALLIVELHFLVCVMI